MSLSETTADIETPTTERQKLPETMTEEEKKLIEWVWDVTTLRNSEQGGRQTRD